MQVLHMGVLTKFFSPLEKRGSLGGFLHISNLPAEKRDSFCIEQKPRQKSTA